MTKGYITHTGPQNVWDSNGAILLTKRLLSLDINDEATVMLADSLRDAICVRGLPNCLSFEVSLSFLSALFHKLIQFPH